MRASKDDAAVKAAYLRRITGYQVTEEKKEYKVNDAGELELTKAVTTTKHVPGDARAAEFWLTNRHPEKWKPTRLLGSGEAGEEGETGIVELPEVAQPPEDGGEGD